jgi:hypothetical protein
MPETLASEASTRLNFRGVGLCVEDFGLKDYTLLA